MSVIATTLAVALTGCGQGDDSQAGNGGRASGDTTAPSNAAARTEHHTFYAVRSYVRPEPSIFVDVFDWTTDASGQVAGTYYAIDEDDSERWRGDPVTGTQTGGVLDVTINRGGLKTPWPIIGQISDTTMTIEGDLYAQTSTFKATKLASVKRLVAEFRAQHGIETPTP